MNKKQVTPFFLFLLATLLSLGTASAQSVVTTSSRDRIQGVGSVKQLAASDNGDITVTYSLPVSGSGTHDFIVRNMRTGTSRMIYFSNPSTGTYALNEIKVDNGTCYFIGQYCPTTLGPSIGNHQTSGHALFGYFSIDDVFSGSATIYSMYISGVSTLNRMTVHNHSQHIFAVGIPSFGIQDIEGFTMGSCLVDLSPSTPNSNTWIVTVVSPSSDETMTDVASTPNGIIVVSKFYNDNYTIGVRYCKDAPLSADVYLDQLKKLYRFNTQQMRLNIDQTNVTYRNQSAPILIDSLTIAHVCSGTNANRRGVCIYRIDFESFLSSDTMKFSDAQYMQLGSGLELKDLVNYYYGEEYHQGHEYAAVLVDVPDYSQSVVARAIWAVPSLYSQRTLTYSNSLMKIGSLTRYQNGKYLFMAGQKPNGTNLMLSLQHNGYMNVRDYQCSANIYSRSNLPMSVSSPSIQYPSNLSREREISITKLPNVSATVTSIIRYNECSNSDYDRMN